MGFLLKLTLKKGKRKQFLFVKCVCFFGCEPVWSVSNWDRCHDIKYVTCLAQFDVINIRNEIRHLFLDLSQPLEMTNFCGLSNLFVFLRVFVWLLNNWYNLIGNSIRTLIKRNELNMKIACNSRDISLTLNQFNCKHHRRRETNLYSVAIYWHEKRIHTSAVIQMVEFWFSAHSRIQIEWNSNGNLCSINSSFNNIT